MKLSEMVSKELEFQEKVYPESLKKIVKIAQLQEQFASSVRMSAVIEQSMFSDYTATVLRMENILSKLPSEELIQKKMMKMQLEAFDYSFENLYQEQEIGKPIVVDESQKTKRIILDIYRNNQSLLTIEPRQFEEIVAELLHSQGYEVELTKQTRDNGYDIIAIKHIGYGQIPLKFLVECKRFANRKVSVDIIRSFKEVLDSEQANRGIIATTSYFTRDAIKKQRLHPYLLDFKDKDQIIKWVNDYSKR